MKSHQFCFLSKPCSIENLATAADAGIKRCDLEKHIDDISSFLRTVA